MGLEPVAEMLDAQRRHEDPTLVIVVALSTFSVLSPRGVYRSYRQTLMFIVIIIFELPVVSSTVILLSGMSSVCDNY